ncbi:hypothetical protein [Flavihumibacter fluvii]|uniref:hypothetical protein n=1 Tax=Flavihumibacter fluvii TaxID=2838157 RepID=UPI001BDF5D5D|nr:hypothetical protein [Flavihumibacter fluvii]ULQ53494.1 hypothetical protein KJS93_04060 [Flavihumibacter fluvii]
MNKSITILFLVVYLFSATEAHQLLKIPVIFEHFSEHQEVDRNISLLQFLAMHYLHGSPKDKDYDRDMQLPFKTSGDCVAAIAPAFIPVMIEWNIDQPVEIIQQDNLIKPDHFFVSAYLSKIWQPPKS